MCARVYVLLSVISGQSEVVARALRSQAGVVATDVLEGPPDVMVVIEAPERQRLAELMTHALTSVEIMTDNMQVLPTQSGTKKKALTH